ncbi:Triacylglycerol lipase [Mycobacterium simulans]|uniref:PE family protein n=1 Tax=Mycobacterium simulans TaxID=627089 RepID=UPI00174E71F6|nr:PE family protein [Mycobacterium simulans]SON60755.1 Triacylglycerol lipase [Mycobacterium simulans]
MSFFVAAPEALLAAAADLAAVGSNINAASASAAVPTVGVLAAGADDVSAQVAALFSSHAQSYQQLSAQVAAFQDQFVLAMNKAAAAYATGEANVARTLASGADALAPAEKFVERVAGIPTLLGTGGSSLLGGTALALPGTGALAQRATAGIAGLWGNGAGLRPVASAAGAPAEFSIGSIGPSIKNFYNEVEPWVEYGVNWTAVVAYYAGLFGSLTGTQGAYLLGPQINFAYYLAEPIFQSALFNTIDVLDGAVTLNQGLSNLWSATSTSTTQFIQTEINWVLNFYPAPPIPTPPAALTP